MSSDWFWRKPTAEPKSRAGVLSQEQMADYFGMARNTFAAIMERQPEVLALYKKGRAKAIGAVAQGLLQRARNGDTTSAIFYLKTQGGWRETLRVEPGSTVISIVPLTTEEWQRRYGDPDVTLIEGAVSEENWLRRTGRSLSLAG